MEQNPYSPPVANVDAHEPRSVGSLTKALTLGLVADTAATLVAGGVFAAVWASRAGLDLAAEDIEATLAQSTGYLLSEMGIGTVCSVLGGYVAARVAKRSSLRVGIYFAIVTALFSTLLFPLMEVYPTWYVVVVYLAMPPACVLGALAGGGTATGERH